MEITKKVIKEKEEKITIGIKCDYCGKEKHKGRYASIGVRDGHWADSGYETYEFCDKECLGNYIKKIEDISLVFTVDEYGIK